MNYLSREHYQKLAQNYDKFWVYSPEFIDFLTQKIIDVLELKSTDTLVDLGCGTGIYTKSIVSKFPLQNPVICVDSSEEMLDRIPNNSQYKTFVKDGIEFAYEPGKYDKILMKEMIHHIADKEKFLQGLFERLNLTGSLLLILLPPTIEYPLFTEALRTYEAVQPNYNDLVKLFQKIGFKTTVDWVEYPVSLPKETYFEMVENRYMSLLSRFDDTQLQKGLAEMEQKYCDQSRLEFCDRFVFISAKIKV